MTQQPRRHYPFTGYRRRYRLSGEGEPGNCPSLSVTCPARCHDYVMVIAAMAIPAARHFSDH